LKKYLKGVFAEETVAKALRTIEHYTASYAKTLEHPGTPIKIRHRVDEQSFLHDVRENHLFGVTCAIGYYANRDLIGAFRLGKSEPCEPTAPIRRAKMSPVMAWVLRHLPFDLVPVEG
jgi:hypothetical protein